jgi:hypothetical protein
MKKVFTLILVSLSTIAFAQTPTMVWQSFLNGNMTGEDEARGILLDSIGNVYVTGTCYENFSGGNFTTVKYNSSGGQQWVDHFAQVQTGFTNDGLKIIQDRWNNFYAVGTMAINNGDLGIIKYNSTGRLWAHNYEPYWFGSDIDFGKDIAIDTSGNLYALAQMTSLSGELFDVMVLKTDSAGTEIYKDNYSSASGDDWPASIAVTPDGNMFALASCFDFWGSATYDITTLNYIGPTENWVTFYNGPGNDFDYGTSIRTDNNGNLIACGSAGSSTGNDMALMKLNSSGSLLWSYVYGGLANGNDTAVSSLWLPNGYAVVTGRCKEFYNSNIVDAIVTILVDSGTVIWTRKYYGSTNTGAVPLNMITDTAGNIFICGYEILSDNSRNGCIIEYDMNGNFQWNISYDSGLSLDDKFYCMTINNNGNIFAAGQSFASANESRYVTVKYGNLPTSLDENFSKPEVITLYPNPVGQGNPLEIISNGKRLDAEYILYDISGRKIDNGMVQNGTFKFSGELNSGVYIISLKHEKQNVFKKFMILDQQ